MICSSWSTGTAFLLLQSAEAKHTIKNDIAGQLTTETRVSQKIAAGPLSLSYTMYSPWDHHALWQIPSTSQLSGCTASGCSGDASRISHHVAYIFVLWKVTRASPLLASACTDFSPVALALKSNQRTSFCFTFKVTDSHFRHKH